MHIHASTVEICVSNFPLLSAGVCLFTLWQAILTRSLNSRIKGKLGKAPFIDDLTSDGCFSVGNVYLNQAQNTGQMHS